MPKIIRNGVFETNSSSSHSIVFPEKALDKSQWNIHYTADIFEVSGSGEYGWGYDSYNSLISKIDYLIVEIESNPNRQYYADKIKRVFEQYTNATLNITFDGGGYIDHQSYGTAMRVLDGDDDHLARYMFDPEVTLIIDSDG